MTEETKAADGALAGVSDSTQLLGETLARLKLAEFRREREEFWRWRKEENTHRRVVTVCVVAECVALVVIAYFAILFHT